MPSRDPRIRAIEQEAARRAMEDGRTSRQERFNIRAGLRSEQGLGRESRKRGGVAGVWDRNKGAIGSVAGGLAASFIPGAGAFLLPALGGALGGAAARGKFDAGNLIGDTLGGVSGGQVPNAVGASAGFTFSDAVTVSGAATFNGNVTLGDATSDTLTITARLVSSIVPSTSGTRSLGADTLRFQNGYIDSWYANNGTFEAGAIDSSTQLLFRSSGGTVSCLRMPHGSAPSSPVNGDMWTTVTGLFVRINGVTVGPLS